MNIRLKAVLGVAFAGCAFAVNASTWTFNGSNSIANEEGTWAFPVTCSGTDLTISGKPSKGSSPTLDLGGAITDEGGTEYHIVAFSGKQHLYSDGTVKVTLPFADLPPGTMIFLVSHKDAGWQAVINDPTQFTRWVAVDAEERAAWREAHPGERRPLGKHLSSGQYVRYANYNKGFAVIVR